VFPSRKIDSLFFKLSRLAAGVAGNLSAEYRGNFNDCRKGITWPWRAEVLKAQTRFTELQFQLQDAMESLATQLKQNPVEEAQVRDCASRAANLQNELNRRLSTPALFSIDSFARDS
jgi:hypothetical protein